MGETLTNNLTDLSGAFSATVALIQSKEDWYRRHKNWASAVSVVVRLAGFVVLAYGAILPIWSGESDFRVAYIALVAGGLLLLLDNLFMFTKSWSRYAGAELALKAAREQLIANWEVANSSANPDSQSHASDALQMLAQATTAANNLVIAETSVWQKDLEQAVKELTAKMDSVTNDVATRREKYEGNRIALEKKSAEEAISANAAAQVGGVNVNLSSAGEALKDVVARMDEQTQHAGSLPAKLGFDRLAPGIHVVRIDAVRPSGSVMPTLSQVLEIKPGQIQTVDVKLPY